MQPGTESDPPPKSSDPQSSAWLVTEQLAQSSWLQMRGYVHTGAVLRHIPLSLALADLHHGHAGGTSLKLLTTTIHSNICSQVAAYLQATHDGNIAEHPGAASRSTVAYHLLTDVVSGPYAKKGCQSWPKQTRDLKVKWHPKIINKKPP